MLERSVTSGPDGQVIGEGSTIGAAALTVMYCMKAWVTTLGLYFGLDVSAELEAIRSTMKTFAQEGVSTS